MTPQELIAIQIAKSVEDLFRSARAMPDDKLDWKPSDTARSALDMLQECAQSLKWPQTILESDGTAFDQEAFEKARQERAQWTTVALCEEAARRNLTETIEYVKSYPDDDLNRVVPLPFAPELKPTVAEILASPYWNLTYHLGQINYLQTMYGDKEMH